MGLVDDEQVLTFIFEKLVGDVLCGFASRAAGMQTVLLGDDVDESKGSGGGVCEVVHGPVGVRAEMLGEFSKKQTLATSGLGEEYGEAVDFEGEEQSSIGLLEATMAQDGRFGCVTGEGVMVQSEMSEKLVHGSSLDFQ
jgi:hypothetical protein